MTTTSKPRQRSELYSLRDGDVLVEWPESMTAVEHTDLRTWLDMILWKMERYVIGKEDMPQNAESEVDDTPKMGRQVSTENIDVVRSYLSTNASAHAADIVRETGLTKGQVNYVLFKSGEFVQLNGSSKWSIAIAPNQVVSNSMSLIKEDAIQASRAHRSGRHPGSGYAQPPEGPLPQPNGDGKPRDDHTDEEKSWALPKLQDAVYAILQVGGKVEIASLARDLSTTETNIVLAVDTDQRFFRTATTARLSSIKPAQK